MSSQFKTALLTILTLSVFSIALVELSGVSSTALFNKYKIGSGGHDHAAVRAQETEQVQRTANMPKTEITFDEMRHDFGSITEGEVVTHSFRFRNTGTQPLLISKVDVSCGCTAPTFPKEPVPPGGEGTITLQFNSTNRTGKQSKSALVYSNAQQDRISIGFDAQVREK
jgi:hypothetical protein